MQTKNTQRFGAIVLGTTILLSSCNLLSDSFYQGKIKGMVSMINKKCPQVVAEGVRLDSASTAANKTMIYHYTMTELELKDIDTTVWIKTVDSALVAEIQKLPELKDLREHDVTFVYDYFDKDSQPIAKFSIAPEKYKEKK